MAEPGVLVHVGTYPIGPKLIQRLRRLYYEAYSLDVLTLKQAQTLCSLFEQARHQFGDDFWEFFGFPLDEADRRFWTERVLPLVKSRPGARDGTVIRLLDHRDAGWIP